MISALQVSLDLYQIFVFCVYVCILFLCNYLISHKLIYVSAEQVAKMFGSNKDQLKSLTALWCAGNVVCNALRK